MKIGLFTEFSYPGKSEQQTYAEVLEQIASPTHWATTFSITESYGKDLFSCSPFPLGLYVGAAQQAEPNSLSHRHHQHAHPPSGDAGEAKSPPRICLPMAGLWSASDEAIAWVINRLGVNPTESAARFEEGIRMLVEIFKGEYIENLDGEFWQLRDFKLSPMPVQRPHPPIYTAAATTPASASFAGKIGQGLVQPGYLGIPFELVRGLTETYRNNLPATSKSDVVLGIHLHVARDREQAIDNGALALSSQAEVFLRGRLSRPVQTEQTTNLCEQERLEGGIRKIAHAGESPRRRCSRRTEYHGRVGHAGRLYREDQILY